jgi:hypothetical protein
MSKSVALPPRASALVEAMRDIGYSFESAVADIVDNSIAASCTSVDIRFGWSSGDPWIAIIDDGRGMRAEELQDAMRPGSQSPLIERHKSDLGRFGLGLKTASFSQCRRLTVVSRANGAQNGMRWDLDVVARDDDWTLQILDSSEVAALAPAQLSTSRGTMVLWQKIDRLELAGEETHARLAMNDIMAALRSHLARVYHRFLSGEPGHSKTAISINGLSVEPFDPFGYTFKGTQHLPEETVLVDGSEVRILPHILPHHSKISPSDYERLAGPEGYLRNQGFYVYRNRRLIIWGTWFRLAKQEELTKLARVRIDVPNNLDHRWAIDVRKSRASPPGIVRVRLKQIIDRIRGSAKRPYTHRGAQSVKQERCGVWERRVFNDRIQYVVNEDHPIISDLLSDLDAGTRARAKAVLRMVADGFPRSAFFSDYAEVPKLLDSSRADLDALVALATLLSKSNPGLDKSTMKVMLAGIEPFSSWPDSLDEVVSQAILQ